MTTAYRLYYQPEGSIVSYCGEYATQTAAATAADGKPPGLTEDLWETARRAGHCGGLYAPDRDGIEEEEPLWWVGDYYVIKARYNN